VGYVTGNKPFYFDADVDHGQDPGIFNGIFITGGQGQLREFCRISWWRLWSPSASSYVLVCLVDWRLMDFQHKHPISW